MNSIQPDHNATRRASGRPISVWHETSRRLLDTVFPPRCVACGERGHWLCPSCLRRVEHTPLPICGVCGDPIYPCAPPHGCRTGPAALLSISAIGAYNGPLRAAVHALKYKGRHGIAATLATLLTPRIEPLLQGNDLLVAVPLHPTRERQRGYNQSAILAAELAHRLPLHLAPAALRRVRETADQTTLSETERARNVRGAFASHPDLVRNRRVLLVDDVHTTGSTLRAAAQALRAAGAIQVRGAVVAMTARS